MKKNLFFILSIGLLSSSWSAMAQDAKHEHKPKSAVKMPSNMAGETIELKNIRISNAWVRPTVTGQKATGAFMTIAAKEDLRLQSGSSAVAGITEVHEMKMEDGVMKMRALENGLSLPAGKAVELKPGGYHVMLMDLKQGIKPNDEVPVSLTFVNNKGEKTNHTTKLKAIMKQAMPAGQKMQHSH